MGVNKGEPSAASGITSALPLSGLLSRVRHSPQAGYLFVLTVIYALVSAAAFHGYYTKWKMSDDAPHQSLVSTLDGTAERPYVFRQLLPQMANAVQAVLPETVRQAIEARLQSAESGLKSPIGSDARREGYVLRYRIVYYATFLSLFAALFVLRSICLTAGLGPVSSTIAPALFALMVPILQTRGGFFYDLPEILAFALGARFALSGRVWALLLLAAPAAANKEAFLFYCLSLLPLLRQRLSLRDSLLTTAAAVIISGLCYLSIKSAYAGNPGSDAIFQLGKNLLFYLNPLNLFRVDQTYGVPLFKGYGIVVLGWFGILMAYGWKMVPGYIHRHLAIAAAINVPLFLLLCAAGEMRNLSMLYVGTVVLIAGALERWMQAQPHAASPPTDAG